MIHFPMAIRFWTAVGVVACLTGCSKAPPPEVDHREAAIKEVRLAEEASIQAVAAKDVDKFTANYATFATLMLPGMPAIKGADIKGAITAMMADKNFSMKVELAKVEVSKSGELGYTSGVYTMTMTDPKTRKAVTEKGKYLTAYAKQPDGAWKIVDDISNADGPATAVGATDTKAGATAKSKGKRTGKQPAKRPKK